LTDTSNYRAIALSTSLSKLYETVLLTRVERYLSTNEAQFGFKKGHSTTQATFVLKETVHHYLSKGSPVYACFLDATKAFDRVCHSKLFEILIEKGMPHVYVKILVQWYRTQQGSVKWDRHLSDPFNIQNGVRQGGNLSPLLFSVYIDALLDEIRNSKIGCHIGGSPMNIIAYADDLVILSPSRKGLQALLNICEHFARVRDITFNVKKTMCMMFRSKSFLHLSSVASSDGMIVPNMVLNGVQLRWISQFKYLGHIITDTLSDQADMRRAKRAIYFGSNRLISRLGYADDKILVNLFQTYCGQIYGSVLWDLWESRVVFQKLCVAYHSCLKRLVGEPLSMRNHPLCSKFDILTCPLGVAMSKLVFQRSINRSSNQLIRTTIDSDSYWTGLMATSCARIRQQYDLINLHMDGCSTVDVRRCFTRIREARAHLE